MRHITAKHARPAAQGNHRLNIIIVISAIAGVVSALATVAALILQCVQATPPSPPTVVYNIKAGGDVIIVPSPPNCRR